MHLLKKLDLRTWKIHTKIIALLFFTILLSTLVLSINSVISLSASIINQNGNFMSNLGTEVYRRNVDLVTVHVNNALTLSHMPEVISAAQAQDDPNGELPIFFANIQANNPQFKSILVSDLKGNALYRSNPTLPASIANSAGFSELKKQPAEYHLAKIRYLPDSSDWESEITIPLFIENTGLQTGYLQITLSLTSVFESLDRINIGKTALLLILQEDGTILYSRDRAFINTPVGTTYDSLLSSTSSWTQLPAGEHGDPSLAVKIAPDQLSDNPLSWTLILEQDLLELSKPISNLIQRTWMIAIAVAIVLGGLGFLSSRSLFQPIDIIRTSAQYLSRGDLSLTKINRKKVRAMLARPDELGETGRSFSAMIDYFREMSQAAGKIADQNLIDTITPKSEHDVLGNAFLHMVASLRSTIQDLNAQAQQLRDSALSLTQNAEQTGTGVQQIANTMHQVSQGTMQQTHSIQQTLNAVEELSRAIDGVAKGAQEQASAVQETVEITNTINQIVQDVDKFARTVAEGSKQAATSAESGSQVVQETIQGMRLIKEKVDQSVVRVEEMGQRSRQVGSILETINDIASQTNLLALNAAIEAARAGEHGKGFAVVADEVRKLAERSAQATQEIAQIITGIQESVTLAVQVMQEGATEVDQGVLRANNAGASLDSIFSDIQTLNNQAAQVETAIQRMNQAVTNLVRSSESVSAVVEENTAATEEMAASSAEVTISIESIANISEESSASMEQVSASTAELFEQADMVSSSAHQLMALAEHLAGIVSSYRISAD